MRYKTGYKEEKRQELLKISAQLAKKQGFTNTGVDGFMKAAQMTSGAFYSHFSSKHELFEALIESELQHSFQAWQANPHDNIEEWIDFELERYLALSHVQRPDQGCVIPSLAAEVARSSETTKLCFQQEMLRGHALFTQHLGSETQAWAVLCQLVGAIVMARSMADEHLQREILSSSKWMIKNMLQLK